MCTRMRSRRRSWGWGAVICECGWKGVVADHTAQRQEREKEKDYCRNEDTHGLGSVSLSPPYSWPVRIWCAVSQHLY